MKNILFILTLMSSFSSSAYVKDPIYDDLEGYDLITTLIRDGKVDFAWEELKQNKIKNQNPDKYELLMGKYYSAKNEFEKALPHYQKAQKSKNTIVQSDADVNAARTHYQLKQFAPCKDLYGKPSSEMLLTENDSILKAQCEFKEKAMDKSWITLHKALEKFPSFAIEREIISLKVSLGMSHEALEDALNWLLGKNLMASQFMNIAEIFHSQNQPDQALAVLEAARAVDPMNMDVNLTLSQMYFQKNLLLASAEGFSRAAETDGKYFYHAAELQRQLGHTELSNYNNLYIVDPNEKLKQKIAVFVDNGNFPMIASLESVIQRSDLSKDDEIRYALAYSLVRQGQVERPLKYLALITKPELIEKTTILRKSLIDGKPL